MSALVMITDLVNEAQRFGELLLLANESLPAQDAPAFGAGVYAVLTKLTDAATMLDLLCENARNEPATIRQIGESYEAALEDWITKDAAAGNAAEDDAALTDAARLAEDAHDIARDVLFAYQPTTPAGFAEKASILLRVWKRAEGMNDERLVQLFKSMGGTFPTEAN